MFAPKLTDGETYSDATSDLSLVYVIVSLLDFGKLHSYDDNNYFKRDPLGNKLDNSISNLTMCAGLVRVRVSVCAWEFQFHTHAHF